MLQERWHHAHFEWRAFASSFLHLDWRWIAVALLLSWATCYGRALRWAVMLRPLRPDPNVWGIFKATAIGFTAVVLLGRPGEFVRPYLIALKEKVPLSSQLAAWVLERLCDLLAVLLVFGFAVSQIHASRAQPGAYLSVGSDDRRLCGRHPGGHLPAAAGHDGPVFRDHAGQAGGRPRLPAQAAPRAGCAQRGGLHGRHGGDPDPGFGYPLIPLHRARMGADRLVLSSACSKAVRRPGPWGCRML